MGVFKRTRVTQDGVSNQYWYIRYRVNGKDKYESVGRIPLVTKTQARALLEDRRRQVRLGQLGMAKTKIPTLVEFTKEFIEYQRDVKRKRSWEKDESHMKLWNRELGDKKLSEITSAHIDGHKLGRLKKVKPSSVNRELEVLRALFYYAKRVKKFFGENPVSESGLLEVEYDGYRTLTHDEEARLMNVCSEHLKPIIITALNTGMRKGEILSLTWNDVDLDNDLITVRSAVSKSKKQRQIPINSLLRKVLLEQKFKTAQNGFVFLTPEGLPYSSKNTCALKKTFGTALRKAEIKSFRFHDLRHTAATRMAESGAVSLLKPFECASTLVGCPKSSAQNAGSALWQKKSPIGPVPKSHQPRQV